MGKIKFKTMNQLQEQLETFRKNYPGIKVMQYDDCLVYTIGNRTLLKMYAKRAQDLIDELGLNLKSNAGTGVLANTFTIKQV